MSGESLRADVFRLRWGRPGWAVPILLFLAVVLVAALAFNLANLDTGGESFPTPATGGTEPTQVSRVDPLLGDLFLAVFVSLLVAAMIYSLLHRRVRQKRLAKAFSWREVLASTIGLVMTLALLIAWPRVLQVLRGGPAGSDSGNTGAENATGFSTAAAAPLSLFLGLTVLASILVMVSMLRRGAGVTGFEEDASADDADVRQAAATAVQGAVDELEIGGDVRSAILACFARFTRLLGARGIAPQLALTPRELEGLAVERLHVSHESSETLTSLFEEARYSEHPLGEADRRRAIESLAGIRAALEA